MKTICCFIGSILLFFESGEIFQYENNSIEIGLNDKTQQMELILEDNTKEE